MDCTVYFEIDGLDELEALIDENRQLVIRLQKNIMDIEGLHLKLSAKTSSHRVQPMTGYQDD